MRRVKIIAIIAIFVFFIFGCSDLFEYNLFSSIDKPTIPSVDKLKEMSQEDAVNTLMDEAESDKFYDELSGNPAKDDIQDYLEDVMEDSSAEPEVKQRAALLYANIEVKTTGADDVVNNLVNVISGEDDVGEVDKLLDTIFPSDEDDAVSAIAGLLGAYKGYETFGENLGDTPPDDVNMGEVAQVAVVSYFVTQFAESNGIDPDSDDAAEDVYDLITNPDNSVNTNMPDPTEDAAFSAILDVAGLSFDELF